MKEYAEIHAVSDLTMWTIKDPKKHKRRYNLPCCNEIAVVISSVGGAPPIDRDIGIYLKKTKEFTH